MIKLRKALSCAELSGMYDHSSVAVVIQAEAEIFQLCPEGRSQRNYHKEGKR